MKPVNQFIFDRYEFDAKEQRADFYYRTDAGHGFKESLAFNLNMSKTCSETALEGALQLYWYAAGSSYYKAHMAPEIVASGLDEWQSQNLSHLYKHGLGEFLYQNQLTPDVVARFPHEKEYGEDEPPSKGHIPSSTQQRLVAIGGGKDSLVTVETLKQQGENFTTFRINSPSQADNPGWVQAQLDLIGAPQVHVTRTLDPYLTSREDQYRGHVPVTAIVSAAAIITAVLGDFTEVVFSNEASADEPTIEDYRGMPINHQYAKSTEVEQMLQTWASRYIDNNVKYYSFLREKTELEIAEIFAKEVFNKYKGKWSSSNTNFRQDAPNKLDWDLTSPKTCTVFALLAPYIPREDLIVEFGGNPFAVTENQETWQKLLGKRDAKPFECVATTEEMQQSLKKARETGEWPEVAELLEA